MPPEELKVNKDLFIAAALFAAISINAKADILSFSSFVTSGDIAAAEGQNSTIAFTYAGNKFVGSVYIGINNNQLYSTDLSEGSDAKFSTPIPTAGGEVVLAASLGQAGFPQGDIYAGSQLNGNIYHISNAGGPPVPFVISGIVGGVRGILFDPGSSFGGKMLVSTSSGNVYTVDSAGTATVLASVGEDTEGMDIATSAWGPYSGYLLVDSEGSGTLRLISPDGLTIKVVGSVPTAETVSFVPLNLGSSGNSLEGFYVANYRVDIKSAPASQFAGLLGDAIITSEFGSNSPVWDLHYDTLTDTFTVNPVPIGHLPNQSEDGIFVTAARINETGGGNVPEPSSMLLFGSALVGLGTVLRRRMRA